MKSKAWHDANSEFIPIEFGYDTDETLGVGICVDNVELNVKKFDIFMSHEEAIKLRDRLSCYIDNAVRREQKDV